MGEHFNSDFKLILIQMEIILIEIINIFIQREIIWAQIITWITYPYLKEDYFDSNFNSFFLIH